MSDLVNDWIDRFNANQKDSAWIMVEMGDELNKQAAEIEQLHAQNMAMSEVVDVKCGECGSTDLEWHCSHETNSGVVDGRLRMHDINTIFYLGCEYCSETVKVVNGDEIAAILTEATKALATYKQTIEG